MPDDQNGNTDDMGPFGTWDPDEIARILAERYARQQSAMNDPSSFFEDYLAALEQAGLQEGGGGGGGMSGSEGALESQLSGLLQQDLANPFMPTMDPQYQQQLSDIVAQMGQLGQQGLPQLDETTRAQLDQMLQSRIGQAQHEANLQQNQLLARLYGSGQQQSDVGTRAGAMFAGEVGRTLEGIRAEDAASRLGLRQEQRAFTMETLQQQAAAVGQQQLAGLQELGLQTDAMNQERTRRVEMLSGIYDRDTQRRIASMQASVQREGIRMSSYLTNLQSVRDAALTREGYDIDRLAIQAGISSDAAARSAAKRSQTMAAIAAIIGAFASDVRVKKNITSLSDLRGYTWEWADGDLGPTVGLLAQDVEQVLPHAVFDFNGLRVINYPLVCAALAEENHALMEEVRVLHSRLAKEERR